MSTTPVAIDPSKFRRRNAVTIKLLFMAGLVLTLLIPLHLVNALRQERVENRLRAFQTTPAVDAAGRNRARANTAAAVEKLADAGDAVFEGYRMVERAVKHGALVLALVFSAFFLFEMLAGLRLHAVHYILVGAALCLFYLALLALGEVMEPGAAYVGAATASSVLITLYSAAILRAWVRASIMAGLLAAVHTVLYIVLRMEAYALLAGTAALFVALAAVMYFTRQVDWCAEETPAAPVPGGTP